MLGYKGVSIYKRGKIWVLQYPISKKTKQKSLRTSDKIEAEKRALEILRVSGITEKETLLKEIAQAKKIKLDRLLVSSAWDTYLSSSERTHPAATTLRDYESFWKQFVNYCELEYIDEITEEYARDYCDYLMGTGIKPQSFNKKKNFISSLFKVIAYKSGINKNPFGNILTKQAVPYEPLDMSESDVNKLLSFHVGQELGLFALGAFVGCRFKDACLMKWENVDLDSLVIKFRPAKTVRRRPDKYVYLPICEDLRVILEDLRGLCEEYVLPNWAKMYLTHKSTPQKKMKKELQRAGVKVFEEGKEEGVKGFHSLRHYFVSNCAKNGVPFAVVQALVGHGSPAMTRNYTHIDVETAREALSKNSDEVKISKIKSLLKSLDDTELSGKLFRLINNNKG